MSKTVAPPLSLVPKMSSKWQRTFKNIAEEGVPLGSDTASSSLSLARPGGDFQKAGASVYGPLANIPKYTESVVVGVDPICSSIAHGVEVRHKYALAAKYEGRVLGGLKVAEQLLGARVAINRRVMHKRGLAATCGRRYLVKSLPRLRQARIAAFFTSSRFPTCTLRGQAWRVVVGLRSVLFGQKRFAIFSMQSSCDSVTMRALRPRVVDHLEAGEHADLIGYFAFEAIALGLCNVVKLTALRRCLRQYGEVVDPNNTK
eukprot:3230473-Pleurochrysis_carterae.AAC.4